MPSSIDYQALYQNIYNIETFTKGTLLSFKLTSPKILKNFKFVYQQLDMAKL